DPAWVGVWEPRAGALFPEACIPAYLDSARRHGAAVHAHEPARAWSADGAGVAVSTARGRYRAERLVLSAGAWMPGLLRPAGHDRNPGAMAPASGASA